MPQDVATFRVRKPHRPQRLGDRLLPGHGREVGADQQPVSAEHVGEVPDRAPVEDQRVVVEAAGQFDRRVLGEPGLGLGTFGFRDRRVLVPGAAPEPLGAGQHQREPPAGVAERDPQARVLLRDPAGDDRRGAERGLRADAERGDRGTRQPVGRHRHAVHEDGGAEPVGLRPEPVELRLVQRLAVDVGGNLDAGQAGLQDLGQLGGGHVRVLQRQRAETVEPGGEGGDQARDVLIGDPAQVAADFGAGPVVQQRGERREYLRVEPAGRRRRQAPLRVEPDRLRGEPHRAVDEELAGSLIQVRVRLRRRPAAWVAPGGRRAEVRREDVRVRVDDRHEISP